MLGIGELMVGVAVTHKSITSVSGGGSTPSRTSPICPSSEQEITRPFRYNADHADRTASFISVHHVLEDPVRHSMRPPSESCKLPLAILPENQKLLMYILQS